MKSFLPLLALCLAPLGALLAQPADKPGADKPGAADAKPDAKAEGFAPLAYFDANCARCHGPNGSFYGKNFGKDLKTDAALKEIVQAMCEGPGNAPLDAAKLEILTDFHRALRDDTPFVTIVARSATGLSGEASPDAKLTLESGAQSVAVMQKGNGWSVNFPADFKVEGAKIMARRGEKVREVLLKG